MKSRYYNDFCKKKKKNTGMGWRGGGHGYVRDEDYTAFADGWVQANGLEKLRAGEEVTVRENFGSDSRESVQLEIGQRGKVIKIDSDGDFYIDFQDHQANGNQWVFQGNWKKLSIIHNKFKLI